MLCNGQPPTHLTEEHEVSVPPAGLLRLGPEGGKGVAVHQVLDEQQEDAHPDAEGKHEEHAAHRADLKGLGLVEVSRYPAEARQLTVPFVLQVVQVSRRQVPRQDGVDLHLSGEESLTQKDQLYDDSATYKIKFSRDNIQQQEEVEDIGRR